MGGAALGSAWAIGLPLLFVGCLDLPKEPVASLVAVDAAPTPMVDAAPTPVSEFGVPADGALALDGTVALPDPTVRPRCDGGDPCSAVCAWLAACVSDDRTCAAPSPRWRDEVLAACESMCRDPSAGVIQNGVCGFDGCADISRLNIDLEGFMVANPSVWRRQCVDGWPDPLSAPPCDDDTPCSSHCAWIAACMSDERTCASPGRRFATQFNRECVLTCDDAQQADATRQLVCRQEVCADLGDSGDFSTTWIRECVDPPPDAGVSPPDSGAPLSPDAAGAPPPDVGAARPRDAAVERPDPRRGPQCADDQDCAAACAWVEACFVDPRVCQGPGRPGNPAFDVMRAFVEQCERDCPLAPEAIAGALCRLPECGALDSVDETLRESWLEACD